MNTRATPGGDQRAASLVAAALSAPFTAYGIVIGALHSIGVDPHLPCPLRDQFAMPCPFCGTTRAVLDLMHRGPAAVGNHPALTLALVSMVSMTIAVCRAIGSGRSLPNARVGSLYLCVLVVSFGANWFEQLSVPLGSLSTT